MPLEFRGKGGTNVSEMNPADSTLVQFFFKHELLQNYRYYWRVECVPPYTLLPFLMSIIIADPKSNSFVSLITTHSCSCKTTTKCTVSDLKSLLSTVWLDFIQVSLSLCTNGGPQLPRYGIPSKVCVFATMPNVKLFHHYIYRIHCCKSSIRLTQ